MKQSLLRTLLRLGLVGLGLLPPVCAIANDSTARIGVGGLELTKTDNISMVSEVLEISTEKIRVTYHFLNTSDKAITTTVAFPMPGYDEIGVVGSDGNASPLDSFHSFVDGRPVHIRKHRVYKIGDVDVTDKLRKIGLSDAQIFDRDFICTIVGTSGDADPRCTLSKAQIAALRKQKLGDGGTVYETAYWEQTFPPGKEITVVHEYTPYVGHGSDHHVTFSDYRDAQRQFAGACLDEDTYRVLTRPPPRLAEEEDVGAYVYYLDVEYILGTGRNWKGPIHDFKLVLRKQSPHDLVSLCFPGEAVKTSPTTLEFSQTDFVPQDKLVVYFFERHKMSDFGDKRY